MDVYSFLNDLGYDFNPIFDDQIHRFKPYGRSDLSGWYIGKTIYNDKLKKDIKLLTVGDWSTNQKQTWCSRKRLSDDEKEIVAYEKQKILRKQKKEKENQKKQAIIKIEEYSKLSSENYKNFGYLKNKKIKNIHNAIYCETDNEKFILIILRNKNGKITSAQKIYEDGKKRFIYGGEVSGSFFIIGESENDKVYICEGWATGVSIYEQTKSTVICCMSAKNLISVANEIKPKLKDKIVYICSDNDKETFNRIGLNPGVDAGNRAAGILNCLNLIPEFDAEDEGTDFNDFCNLYDDKKINKALRINLSKVKVYPTKWNGFYEIIETKKGNVEKPDYDGLADYMIGEKYMKCDDSLVYLWSGKHYKSISFLALKNTINSLIKADAPPHEILNFTNKAQIKSYVNFNEIDELTHKLNCQNGLVDLKTGKLIKHSPDYFIKYVLKHKYDPNADCKTFLKSLNLVTNGDKDLQLLIQQVFGYCIIGGHPKAHKAFMFYGEGGNGKSTILTALSNLVGRENTARVPLTLFDKPFSMISLDGKLVNLIDETPKFNINPEAFKNVVSGGYVRAAHKRKDEIDLKINARIVFACNKLPNFKDDSDGMLRRLVIIPFNHRIPDSEADYDIDDKILKEMPGVLNFAIEGLKMLIDNGYEFHKPDATKTALDTYKQETDSVHYFFKTSTEFTGKEFDNIKYQDLYKIYKNFCKEEGLFAVAKRSFSRSATKYYETIYSENNMSFSEKDRKISADIKGIKRIKIREEYEHLKNDNFLESQSWRY